jgi:single-strand DNA-binding protein
MLFTGRLTANAEVRTTKSDKKVTGFTVAVNHRYKNKAGEKKEKVAYIDCSYWVNPAIAEYLKKGTVVEISGWMEAQAWNNRDGEAKANLICAVDTIKLFGNQTTTAEDKPKAKAKAAAKAGANDDDDLPF